MLIHKDLLYEYTCNKRMFDLHKMVDKYFNCEDLAMNGVAAFNKHKDMLNGSPPLFVSPQHDILDFGKQVSTSLHLQKSHAASRSKCVNQINKLYRSIHNEAWPLQTSVVQTEALNSESGKVIKMWVEPYKSKLKKNHIDCFSMTGSCNISAKNSNEIPKFVWID